MLSGHYFEHDVEKSTNERAIFRYTHLRHAQGTQDMPIYVALNKEFVGFYANDFEHGVNNHWLFGLWLKSDDTALVGITDTLIGSFEDSVKFETHGFNLEYDVSMRHDDDFIWCEDNLGYDCVFESNMKIHKEWQKICVPHRILLLDFLFDLQLSLFGVIFS